MLQRNSRKAVLVADGAMFIIAMFWGSGFGVTGWLLGRVSPLWLLAMRFVLSTAILAPVLWRRLHLLSRKDIMLGCGLGALCAVMFIAHVMGLMFTSAGKQSFIAGSNVVMAPLLFALFYRKMPSMVATLGAVLTTLGLLVMAFTPGMKFNIGDFISLFLALGIALHVLLTGNLSRRMDPSALALVMMASSAVLLLAFAVVFEPLPDIASFSLRVWGGIAYVAVFVTVIPFLVQIIAQRYSPEVHAAIILSLESPSGYFIAVFMGQEMLNAQVVMGGFIILAGVILAELDTFLRSRFPGLSTESRKAARGKA
ncbi:MAG: DMT family transporter [Synergistota bacterium]|nr:DMT family transporter [Synergistota bacterium]